MDAADSQEEQKCNEHGMILVSNANVDPNTMVIHLQYATDI